MSFELPNTGQQRAAFTWTWSRRSLLRILFALAILVGGFLPSKQLSQPGTYAVVELTNGLLDYLWSETDVSFALEPAPAGTQRQSTDQVQTDTLLHLSSAGNRVASYGLSLRRDCYLPWVLFVALVVALPIDVRLRALGVALGSVLILAVAVLSIEFLVDYLVQVRWPDRYDASALGRSLVEFAFDAWLTPPGNRAIAPLLLAAAWWGIARGASSIAPARPRTAQAG